MSPSDRRTVTRGDTALPVDRPGAARVRNGDASASSIAVPEIVPATSDDPSVPAQRAPGGVADPDATESWVESGSPPVVIGTPTGASAPLRVRGRRPRVRKVTRVVRHLDPWSTFKVALVFSTVLYGVLLTSGVLLWRVAANTGTLDNVERWFTQFGWESFELNGGEIYHNAWIAGLFGAVALTGFIVLLATLFNLVSDMVGGVRVTVLEEEVVERTTSPSRRYVVRRLPTDADSPLDNSRTWDASPSSSDDPPAQRRPTSAHRSTVRTARPIDSD